LTIALFTDFGSQGPYVGQVKAVLARDAPGVAVIDLLNDVPAYDVKAGAHLLASLAPQCPQGTVFLAVVDPGVGSRRTPVAVRAGGYRFVGPDNGLLSVFAARAGRAEVFRIAWEPERLSSSFHGRDLFAPVAARLATGTLPPDWLARLPRLEVDFGAGDLAEIIYVDRYGNAMTGIRAAGAPRDAKLVVNGRALGYAPVFSAAPENQAFWYENGQGLVEVAANRASAAEALGAGIGAPVRWAP
jgi:S-adenosyl-L-methionine hydrolase (adenosine-forming)